MTRTSNYALRLVASLKAEAERVAAEEGTTLNQLINVALAEKLAALRTERYFRERAGKGEVEIFKEILRQAGTEPPRSGDEIRHHPPAKARARR